MTIAEMHTEFRLLLDKADGGTAPSFLDAEIDRLLNISQDKFISKRAFGNNLRRTSFEEDQKRRDDLRNIVVFEKLNATSMSIDAHKPNARIVALPESYRHMLSEEALITINNGGEITAKRVGVKPITHDRYNKIIDDPFNSLSDDTVYRLDYSNNSFELISKQPISSYYLRYINFQLVNNLI